MEAKKKNKKRKPKKHSQDASKKLKTDCESNSDTTEEEKDKENKLNGEVTSQKSEESVKPEDTVTPVVTEVAKPLKIDGGGHRAGYDAFMTGYSLAVFLSRHSGLPSTPTDFLPASIHSEHLVNKLYLTCKDHPMLLRKSNFSKPSQASQDKLQRIRK